MKTGPASRTSCCVSYFFKRNLMLISVRDDNLCVENYCGCIYLLVLC